MKNNSFILKKQFRNKITGKISPKIYDVISDELTLNRSFRAVRYGRGLSTLFKEIEIVPYDKVISNKLLRKLQKIKHRSKDTILDLFIYHIKESLEKYIIDHWDSKKYHIILHSSGYDSRIISHIIKKIYSYKGKEWLGHILFVCFGDEQKYFKLIMEYEGWNKDQYNTLDKDIDYLKWNLDFGTAWKSLNGPAQYPANNLNWALNQLDKKYFLNPNNVQIITQSYFNETFLELGTRSWKIENWIKKYYLSTYSNFHSAINGQLLNPILNYETLKLIIESKFETKMPIDIREQILTKLDYDLACIPRSTNTPINLSNRTKDKLKKDYIRSWYGRKKKRSINLATIEFKYDNFWSQWSIASFIEYLINKGVKINA